MAVSNVKGPFQRQNWQCACAVSRDRVVGGHPKPHIWNQRPNLPIDYITFMGLRWRLRGVYMEHPHCTAVFGRKFSPVKSGPKMAVFREQGELNVKFLFSIRKGTSLRGTTSSDVFCLKIDSVASAVGRWKNPKKKPSKHLSCAVSRIRGKETPWRIGLNFAYR